MHEKPETLVRLQAVIEQTARAARPAMLRNFIAPDWRMTAGEFVAFWGESRIATVSTASPRGTPHAVPLDVRLHDGVFYVATFADAARLRDHRANPPCAITSWDSPYRAAIIYGAAAVAASAPDGAPAAGAGMVNVAVTPERIYAIRPPAWHHAAAGDR